MSDFGIVTFSPSVAADPPSVLVENFQTLVNGDGSLLYSVTRLLGDVDSPQKISTLKTSKEKEFASKKIATVNGIPIPKQTTIFMEIGADEPMRIPFFQYADAAKYRTLENQGKTMYTVLTGSVDLTKLDNIPSLAPVAGPSRNFAIKSDHPGVTVLTTSARFSGFYTGIVHPNDHTVALKGYLQEPVQISVRSGILQTKTVTLPVGYTMIVPITKAVLSIQGTNIVAVPPVPTGFQPLAPVPPPAIASNAAPVDPNNPPVDPNNGAAPLPPVDPNNGAAPPVAPNNGAAPPNNGAPPPNNGAAPPVDPAAGVGDIGQPVNNNLPPLVPGNNNNLPPAAPPANNNLPPAVPPVNNNLPPAAPINPPIVAKRTWGQFFRGQPKPKPQPQPPANNNAPPAVPPAANNNAAPVPPANNPALQQLGGIVAAPPQGLSPEVTNRLAGIEALLRTLQLPPAQANTGITEQQLAAALQGLQTTLTQQQTAQATALNARLDQIRDAPPLMERIAGLELLLQRPPQAQNNQEVLGAINALSNQIAATPPDSAALAQLINMREGTSAQSAAVNSALGALHRKVDQLLARPDMGDITRQLGAIQQTLGTLPKTAEIQQLSNQVTQLGQSGAAGLNVGLSAVVQALAQNTRNELGPVRQQVFELQQSVNQIGALQNRLLQNAMMNSAQLNLVIQELVKLQGVHATIGTLVGRVNALMISTSTNFNVILETLDTLLELLNQDPAVDPAAIEELSTLLKEQRGDTKEVVIPKLNRILDRLGVSGPRSVTSDDFSTVSTPGTSTPSTNYPDDFESVGPSTGTSTPGTTYSRDSFASSASSVLTPVPEEINPSNYVVVTADVNPNRMEPNPNRQKYVSVV